MLVFYLIFLKFSKSFCWNWRNAGWINGNQRKHCGIGHSQDKLKIKFGNLIWSLINMKTANWLIYSAMASINKSFLVFIVILFCLLQLISWLICCHFHSGCFLPNIKLNSVFQNWMKFNAGNEQQIRKLTYFYVYLFMKSESFNSVFNPALKSKLSRKLLFQY